MFQAVEEEIIKFHFDKEKNIIESIKRVKSNRSFLAYPTDGIQKVPDTVWKEIYYVNDGKINMKRIEGEHIPESTVKEKFIFDDEKD